MKKKLIIIPTILLSLFLLIPCNVFAEEIEDDGRNTKHVVLDYIEFTGTQYIDLGVKGSNNTSVEIDFKYSSSGNGILFGDRYSKNVRAFALSIGLTGPANITRDNNYYFGFGNDYYNSPNKLSDTFLTTRKILKASSLGADYGNYHIRAGNYTFTTDYSLLIGGYRTGGVLPTSFGNFTLYSLKLNESNEELFNLIPVALNYDFDVNHPRGTICLYNTIDDTYLFNAGTGDFISNSFELPLREYGYTDPPTPPIDDNLSNYLTTFGGYVSVFTDFINDIFMVFISTPVLFVSFSFAILIYLIELIDNNKKL